MVFLQEAKWSEPRGPGGLVPRDSVAGQRAKTWGQAGMRQGRPVLFRK